MECKGNPKIELHDGKAAYGAVTDKEEMLKNFKTDCIPDGMEDKNIEDFLSGRRKIEKYYQNIRVNYGNN